MIILINGKRTHTRVVEKLINQVIYIYYIYISCYINLLDHITSDRCHSDYTMR